MGRFWAEAHGPPNCLSLPFFQKTQTLADWPCWLGPVILSPQFANEETKAQHQERSSGRRTRLLAPVPGLLV